ncbi:hypothetical protein LTR56_010647 [Elasticomyces elasticus]|nr:hypothetical protein LTR56_010647 [Elasticomyces elasticus]KAK5751525.1 hypothetical protein LTS12_018367 [Elasticomyces elasticus]
MACSRAAVARVLAEHVQHRFKHARVADTTATWVDIPDELRFVDGDDDSLSNAPITPVETASGPGAATFTPSPACRSASEDGLYSAASVGGTLHSQDPCRPQLFSAYPVRDEQSALLIRHFIRVVSQFFDFCDEQRHFARTVPQRARSNVTLANAMMACAARHLSLTEGLDRTVADAYYQKCLEAFIPAIATRVDDETMLAVTVILRFMEELEVPITGRDSQDHLMGTQAIVRTYEQHSDIQADTSGLLRAAKMAALRQDMYMSLTTQRPMMLTRRGMFPQTSEGMPQQWSDDEWANAAVGHCSDVLEYVFSVEQRGIDQYHILRAANEEWRLSKPASFAPYYVDHSPGSALPNLSFVADWHTMGSMYNLLTSLLLKAHDPTLPHLGPSRRIAVSSADEEIRKSTLTMAGIARSNPDTHSALLVASMAIAMFGDRLTVQAEQQAVDHVLEQTQAKCGWPTDAARQMLQTAWRCV